ncbi:MAG: hypothetical protein U0M33_08555 [Lachnospiraceae bacterium]|nr:hypothetical protein [Lachnospiraceae bacterium]
MKIKSILSNHTVMLSILFFTFVGYFFAVYRENANQALNCSLLIIAASCLYSENPIFGGKQPENRALRLLAHLDGALLIVWFVCIVAQLFL